MKTHYAHGKLLISAEYMVLHGSKALAVPLQKGQKLQRIKSEDHRTFSWKAHYGNNSWFSATYDPESLSVIKTTDHSKAETLKGLIQACIDLQATFQQELFTWDVETFLEFSPSWGFGSSSTLTALMAEWADVNPLDLHFLISQGSGYDVACAIAEKAITYWLMNEEPHYQHVRFDPPFSDHLYFVWLGKKQKSDEHLIDIAQHMHPSYEDIHHFSMLSQQMIEARELHEFQRLMEEHEHRLSSLTKQDRVSLSRFPDLPGSVKSLGAWGGDFVLVASDRDQEYLFDYLNGKGLSTVFRFKDLVYDGGEK